ncbi:MAG: 30S ribosomal protein S24e [Euryarchaeota archaeon]|nr:30S ribosomal protein S24e [Euryarchaeota archaeon]
MEVTILEEKENPLLDRKELRVKVVHDAATPRISEVRDKMVAMLGVDKETLILDSLKSRFGARESIGFVKVYKTKERALKVEPRHRLEKNLLVEKTKREEKPKAAPKKKEEPRKEVPKKEEKPKAEVKKETPKKETEKKQ